jgi:hypothetical protein
MYIKGTRFYADWTDSETGKRRRKSFTTAKAALIYEQERKAANPKHKASGQSGKSSSPSLRKPSNLSDTPSAPPASSSPTRVLPFRKNSAPPMPSKSIPPSQKADGHTPRAATQRLKSPGFSTGLRNITAHRTSAHSSKSTPAFAHETLSQAKRKRKPY